jgi:hypothetical protein
MISTKLTYANVTATLALFVALGGGAYAATKIVSSKGVVSLCVAKSGAVKVAAAGKRCGKGTTLVAVNQRGPAGQRGTPGLQGPPGNPAAYSAGAGLALSGTTLGADFGHVQARIAGSGCAGDQALQSVAANGTPTCAGMHAYEAKAGSDLSSATMAVPPGTWVLFGQMTAGGANPQITVYCTIDVNGSPVATASQYVPAAGIGGANNGSLFLTSTATTTAGQGTPVDVSCNTGGSGYPLWSNGAILAIPVAALN